MTVCVAAMCGGRIIGASDRMLTAGDVQFEPLQSKILQITNSIAAMVAGDVTLQTEILIGVLSDVSDRIESLPHIWVPVKDVADMFYERYEAARNLRAARAVLHPLGLDYQTYRDAPAELVSRIAVDLVNFTMPLFETIVTGCDDAGTHIYTVRNSGVSCQNSIGFSAIGSGCQHANSQMMFSGHVRTKGMPETLLSVYSSKKRAEVSPGVGSGTDMLLIGPGTGTYIEIGEHVLTELQQCYGTLENEARNARMKMDERIQGYVDQIVASTTAQEQSTPGNDERTIDDGTAALPTGE